MPLSKKNMAALMVARQDGEHYGELLVVDFPKDKLIYGPAQMEARISNDPVISSQLTLWNQAGSEVIRGNLLVVPIERVGHVLRAGLPAGRAEPDPRTDAGDRRLRRQHRHGAHPDRRAHRDVRRGVRRGHHDDHGRADHHHRRHHDDDGPAHDDDRAADDDHDQSAGPGTTLPADAAALIALANQHYEAAIAAQKPGDWATYGAEIQALGHVLEALAALQVASRQIAKNRIGPAMHNEVDRMFLELLRGERAPRYGRAAFRPSADVYYDARENAVIVKLELPGIDPGCVRLEVENNVLTVSGSRSDERHPEAVYQQMEITYGRFERSISLPPEVEAEKATADYCGRVPEDRAARQEEARPRSGSRSA